MADHPNTGGTRTPILIAGRYELGEILGRGSMGTVYRARDTQLDRDVALKLLPSAAADPEHVARFEQEARLLARLSHPGLITVFDAGIDATSGAPNPYLVMRLVAGRTLADRLRNGPLPPPEVAQLAGQLAAALDHIHRQGIVHRDIKPANVMLDVPSEPGGTASATLTDFGIARLVDGTRITSSGLTMGTANYLSPEQISGTAVGAPSDIYSLGLVLLECVTGEVAYPGYGIEAALPRLHRPPTIPDAVPPAWKRLLRAMTELDPAARPSGHDVAAAASGGLAGGATERLPETRVLPLAARHPAWRRWLVLGALLAVVAVIAVVAATVSSNRTSTPVTPVYPSVTGALGADLRQLERAVTPQGMSAAAGARLQADTLTLSRSAANRHWPAAQHALARLRRDLTAALATGELSGDRAQPIRGSAAAVAQDLARKLAAVSAHTPTRPVQPSGQNHPAKPPAPEPKPAKPPKHGHDGHHGHGGGDGGGD